MTVLLTTIGVVFFVLAILASIGLHEIGHLMPAKKFGGKVTQYFIGFGPTVWSTTRGETEYGLKAFPLGGYVKIVGMLPPGAEQLGEAEVDEHGNRVLRVRRSNTGMFTQLISDARAAEWEHVRPGDEDRLFYRLPWWKKVIVMAGGPTMNILIAFFVLWGVFATYGQVVDVEVDPVVERVVPCVVPADEDGRACTARELEEQPTPAFAAGLRPGDRFVSVNGEPVRSWEQLSSAIRENDDRLATFVIERDGARITERIATTVTPRPVQGQSGRLEPVGFLGVEPVATEVRETAGPLTTVQVMATETVRVFEALSTLPQKVWGVARAIVGLEERAADSPVSVVGGGRMAGEIAAEETLDAPAKAAYLASLVVGFNLFIGLFNLLPLLPLDGGHIAGALWEALRRGIYRVLGRPDPGYVDVARLLPVAYVVAVAMLLMGVVLIVGDIVVPKASIF